MKLTEEQLQRVLKDKPYWVAIAAEIISEAQRQHRSKDKRFSDMKENLHQ